MCTHVPTHTHKCYVSINLCDSIVTMEEVDEDMDVIEEGAQMVFEAHSQLLPKFSRV